MVSVSSHFNICFFEHIWDFLVDIWPSFTLNHIILNFSINIFRPSLKPDLEHASSSPVSSRMVRNEYTYTVEMLVWWLVVATANMHFGPNPGFL